MRLKQSEHVKPHLNLLMTSGGRLYYYLYSQRRELARGIKQLDQDHISREV